MSTMINLLACPVKMILANAQMTPPTQVQKDYLCMLEGLLKFCVNGHQGKISHVFFSQFGVSPSIRNLNFPFFRSGSLLPNNLMFDLNCNFTVDLLGQGSLFADVIGYRPSTVKYPALPLGARRKFEIVSKKIEIFAHQNARIAQRVNHTQPVDNPEMIASYFEENADQCSDDEELIYTNDPPVYASDAESSSNSDSEIVRTTPIGFMNLYKAVISFFADENILLLVNKILK